LAFISLNTQIYKLTKTSSISYHILIQSPCGLGDQEVYAAPEAHQRNGWSANRHRRRAAPSAWPVRSARSTGQTAATHSSKCFIGAGGVMYLK